MPAFRGQNWEARWHRLSRATNDLTIVPLDRRDAVRRPLLGRGRAQPRRRGAAQRPGGDRRGRDRPALPGRDDDALVECTAGADAGGGSRAAGGRRRAILRGGGEPAGLDRRRRGARPRPRPRRRHERRRRGRAHDRGGRGFGPDGGRLAEGPTAHQADAATTGQAAAASADAASADATDASAKEVVEEVRPERRRARAAPRSRGGHGTDRLARRRRRTDRLWCPVRIRCRRPRRDDPTTVHHVAGPRAVRST